MDERTKRNKSSPKKMVNNPLDSPELPNVKSLKSGASQTEKIALAQRLRWGTIIGVGSNNNSIKETEQLSKEEDHRSMGGRGQEM
ncbi:hypothetical protein E2542_SST03880 [Spatholobus suberectus]|nr:hypothetical protein E2542_SST03880 [Spatholobus suberectus]